MRIGARLLAGLAASFVVVGAGSGVVYYLLASQHERERSAAVGGAVSAQVFSRIEAQMRAHRGPLPPDLLDELPLTPPVRRVFLVNAAGAVRASTDPALRGRTLSRAGEGCDGCHGGTRASLRLGTVLRWARPVLPGGSCRDCHRAARGPLGCLIVDLGLEGSRAELQREITGGILLLGGGFALICWTTLSLTRRWVLRRIEALAGLVERFEAGDLTPRAAVGERDELARVEGGFNRMAEALRMRADEQSALLERLRGANEELERGERRVRRAYDTQRVLNELLRLSLGEQPLAAVLQRSLDLVLGIAWLAVETRGSVFVDEGGDLVMRAQTGLDPRLVERCARLRPGECLCGLAAAERRLVHAAELDARHTTRFEGMDAHGHYCVPILTAGGEILGVLNLYLRAGHAVSAEETAFLTSVAATLAGVIARHRAQADRERLIVELRGALGLVSKSHQEWQGTFDGITDLISILDAGNRIVKVNRAFAEHFGLHPREIVGRACHEFCLAGHGSPAVCPLIAAAIGQGTVTEEVADPRSGRVFRLSVFPYSSGGAAVDRFVHLAEDVTRLRESEQRLIMGERLAALGQMASGIAHEINNPLASIAGCAESLLGRLERGRYDPEVFREYLGIVHEEVFRCKKITTAMLSFVRGGSYERGMVRLDGVLDRALELVGFQGRLRAVDVVRDYAEGLPEVRASEGELRQVLLIVLTNALDAMLERGTLRCATLARGGEVCIAIGDSGPGITPENLARLFTPFFTTKAERGGTGLGLSIAKRILEEAGGAIAIASIPGQGTTVTICFPAG